MAILPALAIAVSKSDEKVVKLMRRPWSWTNLSDHTRFPLVARNGHHGRAERRPLSGV